MTWRDFLQWMDGFGEANGIKFTATLSGDPEHRHRRDAPVSCKRDAISPDSRPRPRRPSIGRLSAGGIL